MVKLKDILNEAVQFTNWVRPTLSDLKREYKVEHELKGLNYFDSEKDFIDSISSASEEYITPQIDRAIEYRSNTKTYNDILKLIKGYRSYPEFRNEKTLQAIYAAFNSNDAMTMPIVIRDGDRMRVFAGNTRMDIAFQLGINPKVLMVDI